MITAGNGRKKQNKKAEQIIFAGGGICEENERIYHQHAPGVQFLGMYVPAPVYAGFLRDTGGNDRGTRERRVDYGNRSVSVCLGRPFPPLHPSVDPSRGGEKSQPV